MDDFLSGWNLLLLALAVVFSAGAFAVWQANIDTPIYTVQFVSPFHYNAKGDDRMHLNDEYVTLKNTGEGAIDMTGWSLRNERNDVFIFPGGFNLPGGATVTVYTGCGVDTETELYWCSADPVWNNKSFKAVLKTATGMDGSRCSCIQTPVQNVWAFALAPPPAAPLFVSSTRPAW